MWEAWRVHALFGFVILSAFLHVHQSQKLSEPLHLAQMVKRLPAVRETQVRSLDWEDPLEKEMATHFSTLAWKIPQTEEPGRLQSMGSQRVGHDWATSLSLFMAVLLHRHYWLNHQLLVISSTSSPSLRESWKVPTFWSHGWFPWQWSPSRVTSLINSGLQLQGVCCE